MQGGSLQEGIFNKGELKNRFIFNIPGVSVSLASKRVKFHSDSVHGRNVGMTKWGVDNLGLLANCNDCESNFSDLNVVLYISVL